jgi:hypothetical protein
MMEGKPLKIPEVELDHSQNRGHIGVLNRNITPCPINCHFGVTEHLKFTQIIFLSHLQKSPKRNEFNCVVCPTSRSISNVDIVVVIDKKDHPYTTLWQVPLACPIKVTPRNNIVNGGGNWGSSLLFSRIFLEFFCHIERECSCYFRRDCFVLEDGIVTCPPNVGNHNAW